VNALADDIIIQLLYRNALDIQCRHQMELSKSNINISSQWRSSPVSSKCSHL